MEYSQLKRDQKEETGAHARQSTNDLHHLSTIRQDELLARLNMALTEMQETVRANEGLRAENRTMAEQVHLLKSQLENKRQHECMMETQAQ
mmetsp:Transcript_40880/g.53565  ORF Transcript_40880/g.53565 Transcript_40880/m.53565 type:complete len:91 (-) Transcript_40880:1641-1913(-)